MAEARTGVSLNQGGPRASCVSRGAHAEEQVQATSRDTELAMELVAREALERGVDREVVLAEQEFGSVNPVDEEEGPVLGKGKFKVDESGDLGTDPEAGLAWENKLAGQKAWQGADQVATVTLQAHQLEQTRLAKAAMAHTQAMACFTDGRPLVSPAVPAEPGRQ
jgi:hypothetical protein